MKTNRYFLLGVVLLIFGLFPLSAVAEDNISVVFNDRPLSMQVQPVIEQEKIFLPVRAAAEAWGAQVDYVESERRVIIRKEGLDLSFVIGEKKGVFNSQAAELITPAILVEDRTLLESGIFQKYFAWQTELRDQTLSIATEQTILIDQQKININKTGEQHEISYYVTQNPDGMPLFWTVRMNEQDLVSAGNEDGFYGQSRLQFDDIDGDQIPEALLYRYNTGSSGGQGLLLLKPGKETWEQIFSTGGPNDSGINQFEMEYLGSYQVSFKDLSTGLQTVIELDRDSYRGIEDMLKGIGTWVDPISDFKVVDIDGDGIKEVTSIQRVIGVSHADTIATWQATYKLHGGVYQMTEVSLNDAENSQLARASL